MRMVLEGGPDADTLPIDTKGIQMRQAQYLQDLNKSLHEASQPMTVLLCTLEYGASLNSAEEMRETMMISQGACNRLQKIVLLMQQQVREAIEAEKPQTPSGQLDR